MTTRFGFLEATDELLGYKFLTELDRVIRRIRHFPISGFEIEPEIRRAIFTRFPYALIYSVEAQEINVIAVAHTHRRPKYWVDRSY